MMWLSTWFKQNNWLVKIIKTKITVILLRTAFSVHVMHTYVYIGRSLRIVLSVTATTQTNSGSQIAPWIRWNIVCHPNTKTLMCCVENITIELTPWADSQPCDSWIKMTQLAEWHSQFYSFIQFISILSIWYHTHLLVTGDIYLDK